MTNEVEAPTLKPCKPCNGTGKVSFMGPLIVECKYCNGTGQRTVRADTLPALDIEAAAREIAKKWIDSEAYESEIADIAAIISSI